MDNNWKEYEQEAVEVPIKDAVDAMRGSVKIKELGEQELIDTAQHVLRTFQDLADGGQPEEI